MLAIPYGSQTYSTYTGQSFSVGQRGGVLVQCSPALKGQPGSSKVSNASLGLRRGRTGSGDTSAAASRPRSANRQGDSTAAGEDLAVARPLEVEPVECMTSSTR